MAQLPCAVSTVSHLFTLACALGILSFRYVLLWPLLELLCWFALIIVELLPRIAAVSQLSPHAPSFWESPAGQQLVDLYEVRARPSKGYT